LSCWLFHSGLRHDAPLRKHNQTAGYGCRPEQPVYSGKLNTNPYAVPSMNEVTRILSAIEQGDPHAAEQLLPLVYDELRKLAAHKLTQEKPGQTLDATALVHEAYLRLVDSERRGASAPHWDSCGHFFAAAAEAMRRILVEQARRKRRVRHGGGRKRIDLGEACSLLEPQADDLLALDEALTRLAALNPIRAEVVKLRFFAGLTMAEVARTLGISQPTAERYWAFARTWLYADLQGEEPPSGC
jgi:RNA polymerase sigma factor (TIGR02999 family)